MKLNILQIIKEEVDRFTSDWQMDDEPSIADKYYEKNLGIMSQKPTEQPQVDGELIGYLDKAWSTKLPTPVPVYKNPRTLTGYANYTRGVLISNGDVFVALNDNGLHLNIIELLGQKGIIPVASIVHNYGQVLPEEYITIIRVGNTNSFAQSTAYDEFPIYYEVMFDEANKKHTSLRFKQLPLDKQNVWLENEVDEEIQSLLDPNWMLSYAPDGYDRGIVNEKR